jgi:hypothetical protein
MTQAINNIIQVNTIVNEAKQAARDAAEKFFQEKLGGVDQYSCGFAWVDIFGIKGNTKLGKAFKAAGIRKSYTGSYQIWNPADMGVQNIDTLEAGAEAAAKVFEKYGFRAYAGSRLD